MYEGYPESNIYRRLYIAREAVWVVPPYIDIGVHSGVAKVGQRGRDSTLRIIYKY